VTVRLSVEVSLAVGVGETVALKVGVGDIEGRSVALGVGVKVSVVTGSKSSKVLRKRKGLRWKWPRRWVSRCPSGSPLG
jgi:hypothetical protein